jgi:hypothetical protein
LSRKARHTPTIVRVIASRRREGLLFLALSAAALLVYAPRTYRTVTVMGDSAELVSAAARWGVPHPPGYPLYTSMAHLMTRVPAFELPFRVHITSAFFHAVTVGVVGAMTFGLTRSLAAALTSATTLALSRIFFSGSLYAEVFPLNDLFSAGLLWFALRMARAEEEGGAATVRFSAAAALLLGASLAHHHMIVLAFPALAILVGPSLWRHLRARPRSLLPLVGCLLAPPIVFYMLIPLAAARHPVPSWGDVHDLGALLRLMTRQDYGGVIRASRNAVEGQLLERLDAFAWGTAESFGVVGVLLFLAGALAGLRHKERICIALLVGVVCAGPLFASLNAFDIHSEYRVAFFERFTTMCHVPFAVVIGLGAAHLEGWLVRARGLSPRALRAAMGVTLALAIGPLLGNLGSLDFSSQRAGLHYVRDLVESTSDGALVLLKSDMASQAALYACAVEQRCGTRIILTPGQLWMPWKQREIERRHSTLSLPPEDAPSAARWLVEKNLTSPIFIHPELVDDVVHGPMAILPSLLLFRVYPDEVALRSDLPRFRAELDAIAAGRRCEGCLPTRSLASNGPADIQLERLYDAALLAHATAASQLGWTEQALTLSSHARKR